MEILRQVLIATHIAYRNAPPYEPLEGPYSYVANDLILLANEVKTCQIPLSGFSKPVLHGDWTSKKELVIPKILGEFTPVKYLIDAFLVILISLRFILSERNKNKLVIGVDPLCCVPLALLRRLLKFKLIFYSVDFNRSRFKNKILQTMYEKADEISTKGSDETWVVCESLKDYKKEHYGVDSFYMPHSPIFNPKIYESGEKLKKGNKVAWTGSLLTERQYDILFGLLKKMQEVRNDLEFYFAPMGNYEKFSNFAKSYGLNESEVVQLHSRAQWQEFAASCDVGIAVYDPDFGSTEFIEPTKIWDFLMCGLPFIISGEPSLAGAIKKSGVAYVLAPNNEIADDISLASFLKTENLKEKREVCVRIAKEFSQEELVKQRLSVLFTTDKHTS